MSWGDDTIPGVNRFGDAEAIEMGKLMEAGAMVPGHTATESGVPILNVVTPLSIAISLKRIADVVAAPGFDFASISHNIEQLAWNAGRSFTQGQRTDR